MRHELDVCTQHTECFVDHISLAWLHNHQSPLCRTLDLPPMTLRVSTVLRYLSEERNAQYVKVFAPTNLGIGRFAEVNDGKRDGQTYGKGYQKYHVAPWSHGT